jgi:N-methylhydantoinase B
VDDVREDVRQGYVSVKAAAERYGVVVDPRTFAVDVAATKRLRAARRMAG